MPRSRRPELGLCVLIAAINAAAWICGIFALRSHPMLYGTAVLAYTLGLRHAVDADHIAAIDNATRKLMQQGGRPITVGLWFAFGHASVVWIAALIVATASSALQSHLDGLKELGAYVGTCVSVVILFLVAAANMLILLDSIRQHGAIETGGKLRPPVLPFRWARRTLGLVNRACHMYPVGVLFGLGFDTATEIAVLAIAAVAAARNMTVITVMIFPTLFTAAMVLVDAIDGLFMVGMYGWAMADQSRRYRYNVVLTLMSILVAVGIGSLEVLQLAAGSWHIGRSMWARVLSLSDSANSMGLAVICAFASIWLTSICLFWIHERIKRARSSRAGPTLRSRGAVLKQMSSELFSSREDRSTH